MIAARSCSREPAPPPSAPGPFAHQPASPFFIVPIGSFGSGFVASGLKVGDSISTWCSSCAGIGRAGDLLDVDVASQDRSPPLSAEMKALIGRISHQNPLWGTERIRGELLMLGITVSNRSIRRYRWRRLRPGDHQRWRTFLSNQLRGLWAADLFVVQTVTFRTLYIFFFVRERKRQE